MTLARELWEKRGHVLGCIFNYNVIPLTLVSFREGNPGTNI